MRCEAGNCWMILGVYCSSKTTWNLNPIITGAHTNCGTWPVTSAHYRAVSHWALTIDKRSSKVPVVRITKLSGAFPSAFPVFGVFLIWIIITLSWHVRLEKPGRVKVAQMLCPHKLQPAGLKLVTLRLVWVSNKWKDFTHTCDDLV